MVASLAREFFVSRAHIRSILQAAETLGMLTRSQADGPWRLEPRFKLWVGRFAAALFQSHIFAMDRALALCADRFAAADAAEALDLPAMPPAIRDDGISPRLMT